ncbi:MAG: radical SAM family heme chaperone HemW [Dehalococcoidales bacterium]|nr:radical SAM family heme chaperone HemW [Dehalococcoidales bacterium]
MRGLYIHIPFCVKKCAYCDFYSVPSADEYIGNFADAVIIEAQKYNKLICSTFYIGGGTPSILGTENLNRLLSGIYAAFDLRRMAEATIEVNPDSATPAFLKTAKRRGFNRVSIGVQSLVDTELKSVGRIHTADQATAAVMNARQAGFKSISADLIIGLPEQNWTSLRLSLESLTGLEIQHLSLYCLSLEPGTPLAENPPKKLPSDNIQAKLFDKACDFLDRHGFIHYEISNFAKPGYECKHNLNYWRGGEYVGLGPAAASHFEGKRYKNKADLEAYLNRPTKQVTEEETLPPAEKAAEEAMLRLRLLQEGLDIDEMAERFGEPTVRSLMKRLNRLVIEGSLLREDAGYRLNPAKVLVSNPILARVLGD